MIYENETFIIFPDLKSEKDEIFKHKKISVFLFLLAFPDFVIFLLRASNEYNILKCTLYN